MRIGRTDSFKKDYRQLPSLVQESFDKKIRLFMKDTNHPSLRVKKMKGHENRWEASITMFYRFTFEVHADRYLLRRVGPHDRVLKQP